MPWLCQELCRRYHLMASKAPLFIQLILPAGVIGAVRKALGGAR